MSLVRSSILLAIIILVVSLIGATLGLLQTPDSDGLGRDSFGTRSYGQRGLYELLSEIGVPVKRRLAPPRPDDQMKTIVLLEPDPTLAGFEPSYLQQLIPWIEQGGRLVFSENMSWEATAFDVSEFVEMDMPTVLESLGLDDVYVVTEYSLSEEEDEQESSSGESEQSEVDEPANRLRPRDLPEALTDTIMGTGYAPRLLEVTCSGSLSRLASDVQHLAVPGDELGVLLTDETKPSGTISYRSSKSECPMILAAEFPIGEGSVIVVAEPRMFSNRMLSRVDNSVLAAELISPSGTPVVFDEFYHGLSVRGNMLFLLTRPGYATLALGILLLACLIVWRDAVFLGPSLTERTPSRRDIGEYIRAMGSFFTMGRKARPFLVRQVRDGVVRELAKEAALPNDTQDIDRIAAVLARSNPRRGDRFRNVVREVDAALAQRGRWTETHTLDAMRRLTSCLSKSM